MMLYPPEEVIRLSDKLLETSDVKEREEIRKRIKEIMEEERKKLENYPFCH